MENYRVNIMTFLFRAADEAHDCVFIIIKHKALFKQSCEFLPHTPCNVCADELSIDRGLLPWQSVAMLAQQTNDFYTGGK